VGLSGGCAQTDVGVVGVEDFEAITSVGWGDGKEFNLLAGTKEKERKSTIKKTYKVSSPLMERKRKKEKERDGIDGQGGMGQRRTKG